MLRSVLRRSCSATPPSASHVMRRGFASDSAPERKVAVLGAAGGIGQPLALLMKLNPLVSKLALYDIAGTPGVAADVSHINTRSEVSLSLYITISVSSVIITLFLFLLSFICICLGFWATYCLLSLLGFGSIWICLFQFCAISLLQ